MTVQNSVVIDAMETLRNRILNHLQVIYRDLTQDQLEIHCDHLIKLMNIKKERLNTTTRKNHWNQSDIAIITYGDSIKNRGQAPLKTLKAFLDRYADGLLNIVHILPFFPWSSDDGFSVMDYTSVNESLGSWSDIKAISSDYDLMSDLVINHCSSRSVWFTNFLKNADPGREYFFTADKGDDLTQVVRPRTTPLLKKVSTSEGDKHVWCTFGEDQIDFNFKNPEVIKEFVKIIKLYLDNGVRIFRLDAVAFLWKVPGTVCAGLPETHEIIRLFRTLIEQCRENALLVTETNIPNRENLSYFGNGNEAHCIYNFSLPPLLINTLVTGDCAYLKQWMMSMPPAQEGTAYLNFIASHDGIGLRPLEGLITTSEIKTLINTMQHFGAEISYRAVLEQEAIPYEINISLFDALKGTISGPDSFGIQRFICAHAIMLGLEGIPAIYIHSLLGTKNDNKKVKDSGQVRAINRHQYDLTALERLIKDPSTHHGEILESLKKLIAIRRRQPAFHPNATQFTLHLSNSIFGFWRQSPDRRQSIFCLSNVTVNTQRLRSASINLIQTDSWVDLLTNQEISPNSRFIELAPLQTVWISNEPSFEESNRQTK